MMRWTWQQLWCQISGGHDDMRAYAGRRIYLRCINCGRETPGWTV